MEDMKGRGEGGGEGWVRRKNGRGEGREEWDGEEK